MRCALLALFVAFAAASCRDAHEEPSTAPAVHANVDTAVRDSITESQEPPGVTLESPEVAESRPTAVTPAKASAETRYGLADPSAVEIVLERTT